jgi:hypothetical protein
MYSFVNGHFRCILYLGYCEHGSADVSLSLPLFLKSHINYLLTERPRDLVLAWILHDGDHTFHLILSEFPSPLGEVSVCFPQHHLSISLPYTLNGSDGKGYFSPPIDVGVSYS